MHLKGHQVENAKWRTGNFRLTTISLMTAQSYSGAGEKRTYDPQTLDQNEYNSLNDLIV